MGYFETLVLGIAQGPTEFLPISSSTYTRIFSDLFGWGDPGATFTTVIQSGTEAAVIMYLVKDIGRVTSHWSRSFPLVGRNRLPSSDPDACMGWIAIFGTILIGVLGLLLQDAIETKLRNFYIVAVVLALFTVILGWADRRSAHTRRLDEMTLGDGVFVGFGQAMVLVPGVSHLGGTITAGLFLEYTREAATWVSSLLVIPAVALSGFFQPAKNFDTVSLAVGPTILATIVSFVAGCAMIVWLLKPISTQSYMPLVVYRIVLAIVVVSLLVGDVVYAY